MERQIIEKLAGLLFNGKDKFIPTLMYRGQPISKEEFLNVSLLSLENNENHFEYYYDDCISAKIEYVENKKRPKTEQMKKREKFNHKSAKFKQKIYDKYNNKCVKCGTTKNLQIDHIVALHNGGTNDADNLQILCKTCNLKKGTKDNKQFMEAK